MSDYPYRQGVNAFVLDKNNLILLVQKQSYDDNQWEVPGGGLEENEDPKSGILRELEEELGSANFEILKESPLKTVFEWPKEAQERAYTKHSKWWRGQEKHQFIVRFTGKKDEIILQDDEIRKIKWVSYSELKEYLVFKGQWENAIKVLEDFGIKFG